MNATIKKLWIDALRSGRYKQGYGQLRDADGALCCLGVLCEALGVPWIYDEHVFKYGAEGANTFLPIAVWKGAGLTRENPFVHGSPLTCHNDVHKRTFLEIADMIEEEL